MLHLIPIRLVLQFIAGLIALTVLAAAYAGWVATGNAAKDALTVIKWSSSIATAAVVFLYAGWRWLPRVQLIIFPYLGGRWYGTVEFESEGKIEQRPVLLEVKHTLFAITLLLESKESISWTLVVQAARNREFDHYRLYYVYLNERKEGVPEPGARYRGLAIIRIETGPTGMQMEGDYFTETHRQGTLHLVRDSANAWWKLWR